MHLYLAASRFHKPLGEVNFDLLPMLAVMPRFVLAITHLPLDLPFRGSG